MPLEPYIPKFIRVPLRPLEVSPGIFFLQEGVCNNFSFDQPDTGETIVRLNVRVRRFAPDDTTYSTPLNEQDFPVRPFELIGNNDTLVHRDTGAIVCERKKVSADVWDETIRSHPDPLRLQGDWLNAMLHNPSGYVPLLQLLLSNIGYADLVMHKFDYQAA